MRWLVLLTILPITPFADGQPQDVDPLAALRPITRQLDTGGVAFLRGETVSAAFPAWATRTRGEAAIRKKLRDLRVTRLAAFGVEIEVDMVRKAKTVYRLKAFAVVVEGELRAALFRGTAYAGIPPRGRRVDQLPATARACGTTARQLVELLRDDLRPRIAPVDAISKHLPVGVQFSLTGMTDDIRKTQSATARAVQALGPVDALHVRMDDVMFVAYAGKVPVGGLWAELRIAKDAMRWRFRTLDQYEVEDD